MAARPPLNDVQKRFQRRSWFISLAAAIPMIGAMLLIKPLLPDRPVHGEDVMAIMAGAMMVMMGLIMTIVHFARPKDAAMPGTRLAQLVSVFLGGAGLFLPIVGERFIDPWINFSLVMALSVVSWVTSWMVWRAADELMRSLMRDSAVAGFYLITGALWIYAVGERVGIFSGVSAWAMLALATIATLATSMWATIRRGMDRPPAEE
jgi:uncharacterized membrane protein HdeD (DUF308 family)